MQDLAEQRIRTAPAECDPPEKWGKPPYVLAGTEFASKNEIRKAAQKLLYCKTGTTYAKDSSQFKFLIEVFKHGAWWEAKSKKEIHSVEVVQCQQSLLKYKNPNIRTFAINHEENDKGERQTIISYNNCINPKTPMDYFTEACRYAVERVAVAKKQETFDSEIKVPVFCAICSKVVSREESHADHTGEKEFVEIIDLFLEQNTFIFAKIGRNEILYKEVDQAWIFEDPLLEGAFAHLHAKEHQLQIVHKGCNLGKSKKKRQYTFERARDQASEFERAAQEAKKANVTVHGEKRPGPDSKSIKEYFPSIKRQKKNPSCVQ